MRSFTLTLLSLVPMAALCPAAIGQAVTEYGLGAGRAATTTAPARNAANAIAGALANLSKAAGADSSATSSQVTPADSESTRPAARSPRRRTQTKSAKSIEPAATPPPAAPAPVYEDPRSIRTGMDYDEMVRRFGPPSMMVTAAPGVNTLWYSSRETSYQVEVKDGKVTAGPGGASAGTQQ